LVVSPCRYAQTERGAQDTSDEDVLERRSAVKIMPDFGTLRENEAAFDLAVASITSGDIAWGRSLLAALRDHIVSTEEKKSAQWILPKVLEALEELKTCTPTPSAHVR
jgi:hypothetical protein